MPNIQIDITRLVEQYFTPLVLSFLVGLVFYIAVFGKEWEWPTVIGCGVFLVIRTGIWMKENYDWNKHQEAASEQDKAAYLAKAQRQEAEIREAAKIFLHNTLDTAVALYNHPKHPGESETERYVSIGEEPGFKVVNNVHDSGFVYNNKEYLFLYCDNELTCGYGGQRHIVFHPIFYQLVSRYIQTGIISF